VAHDDSAQTRAALRPYVDLLGRYLAGEIADADFEDVYNALYMNDPHTWDHELFDLLDGVFATAEAFEADPTVRAELLDAVGPDELRAYVQSVNDQLRGRTEPA
jgi:hypothetical protein